MHSINFFHHTFDQCNLLSVKKNITISCELRNDIIPVYEVHKRKTIYKYLAIKACKLRAVSMSYNRLYCSMFISFVQELFQ